MRVNPIPSFFMSFPNKYINIFLEVLADFNILYAHFYIFGQMIDKDLMPYGVEVISFNNKQDCSLVITLSIEHIFGTTSDP